MTGEAPIDEAIVDYVREQGSPKIVTGWIVVVASSEVDDDGERSGIDLIFSGGNMPWIPALGMIEAARLKMHGDWMKDEA
jgi:hypothetical protein